MQPEILEGPLNLTPISRRDLVMDGIKNYIITKGLQPGDILPTESELCELLGASRSSIREAMRALATLEITEVHHGKGTYVGPMTLDPMVELVVFRGVVNSRNSIRTLRDIVTVRQSLDLAETDHIVAVFNNTSNPDLWALVHDMEVKAERGETFPEEDRTFHTTIISRLNNPLMTQLVGAFWDIHSGVLPQLGLHLPKNLIPTARAHGDMLFAAESGDAKAWRTSVIAHYEPLMTALKAADVDDEAPAQPHQKAGREEGEAA